jgi:hypothetical protein
MAASVMIKVFLMTIVSSQVFCGGITPSKLFFSCYPNIPYVAGSAAAVAIMGAVFGYYIVRIRTFEQIFPRMMKGDFLVTAMYLAVSFSAADTIASRVMIWLFGTWILGMLLAPFHSDRGTLKKITEYGSLVALGALMTANFVPGLSAYGSSYTLGMMVSSVTSIFGAGRQK